MCVCLFERERERRVAFIKSLSRVNLHCEKLNWIFFDIFRIYGVETALRNMMTIFNSFRSGD